MKLAVVALCDRATVREGLLHMLGGGVTQVAPAFVPTTLDLDLALLITADDYREFVGSHKIGVLMFRAEDGQAVAQAEIQWDGPDVELPEGFPSPTIPLSVPMRALLVPSHGLYRISVTVDDEELAFLPLLVAPPGEAFSGVVTPQI